MFSYKGSDETFEGPTVTREHALEYFTPLTLSKDLSLRAKAIRAILALQKGGKCQNCQKEVANYANLYRWHFDHVNDLKKFPVSPITHVRQYRISGNDIARRSFDKVVYHAMNDTQLLCSPCHFNKTQATALNDNSVNATVDLIKLTILGNK